MQRRKENRPPLQDSARKSRLPQPKSAEMTRKRRNNSPPTATGRPPVPKSPRNCGGKRTAAFSRETCPQDLQTPKAPLRSINRQFSTTDYNHEDTEFETDDAALLSILSNTGIESTPGFGQQTRHTLATVNNQRNSIYAPPEKKDAHFFRKMCEEFARGRSQKEAKKNLVTGQSAVHKSPGLLAGAKAMRRMTTDSQFTPKRRCFENKLIQESLSASKENYQPGRLTDMQHVRQNKDIRVHFKGDSLGVLAEEETEELTQDKNECARSVNKDQAAVKKKRVMSFTTDFTPQRVPNPDRLSLCPATDSVVRYQNKRESMPGRVLIEIDGFYDITKTPPVRKRVGIDHGLPGTPKELKKGELACLTPSRVLVQKKLSTTSPKVYSFSATPMRVLKHGRSKSDYPTKSTAQESPRASNSEQKPMSSQTETATKNVEDTEIGFAIVGVQDYVKQSYIEPDLMNVAPGMNTATMSKAIIGENDITWTESGTCIKEEMEMSSDLADTIEDSKISDGFPIADENAVWTPKMTTAKTPIKQEILMSKIEKSHDLEQLTLNKDQGIDSDVTRNHHQSVKLEYATYTDGNQSTYEWNRPTMQLPIVISPVDKPPSELDEMPDPANTNWCRSKTGTLLPQSLKFNEIAYEKDQEKIETTPAKSCNISSTAQELLERIQQHHERKLQRLENTRSAATLKLISETENTLDDHINIQNNNFQAGEDNFYTGETIKTAGQFESHTTQGIDNQSNATSHIPLDINCNIGPLAVNISHEAQSNTIHHPLTNTNVTLNMSEHKDADTDKHDVDIERATKLRNSNMKIKVVSPDIAVNIDDNMTPKGHENPNTSSLMNSINEDVSIKIIAESSARIYAPTPRIIRKPEIIKQEDTDLKSTIPLMTPLALKMVAERTKTAEDSTLGDTWSINKSMQKPKFYHQTENRELSSLTEDLSQHSSETLHKTPPPSRISAFSVNKKSSLTPLVGSMSLRANSGSKTRTHNRACSRDGGLKGILMSMNERYQEALLDDEVTRFAERMVAEQVGYFPRCTDPVAKILLEGDDMHFMPIEEDCLKPSCSGYIPGSAFNKHQTLVG